jgi:hypothetical protein
MMVTKYHIMAECKESGIGKNGFKLALTTLLATVGVGLASCNKSTAAEQQAQNPPAKELVLASADEAKTFSTLSIEVQRKIRAEFDKCMADVEDFANEETNPKFREIAFNSGADDCDGQRENLIRSARAKQDMDDLTRSITSGS